MSVDAKLSKLRTPTRLYYVSTATCCVLLYGETGVILPETEPKPLLLQLWLDLYGPAEPRLFQQRAALPWSDSRGWWAEGWRGWIMLSSPIMQASSRWKVWPPDSDLELLGSLGRLK